ncbi:MAG: hypothetical protein JXX14_18650 [Deltaproteobacteria bacterium]|nr:hypothetical protein [Deltaproteobacteria bacterium]
MTGNSGNDSQWKGRRDRDDTPSFIRNVEAKSSILNPGTRDSLPVLAVPRSVQVWNRIRWPLAVFTVLVILTIVGLFTHNILENKNVNQRLKDSLIGEKFAHVQVMYESNRILKSLSEEYDDYANVQAAFAWNTVLLARLFNEQDTLLPGAVDAFEAIDNESDPIAVAAMAGYDIFNKKYSNATTRLTAALASGKDEPRLHLAAAWLDIAMGKTDDGLKKLEQMRRTFPEYLPPLYTLIEVSIASDDELAIDTYSTELLSLSRGNLYGALTSLLIRLPKWNSDPLAPKVLKELVKVATELKTQVKDAPVILKTYAQFMEGRLALQKGNYEQAIAIFKPLLDDRYQLNTLAWYGKAVMENSGPKAALAALQSAGKNPRIEIYDLRARAYLALYDVNKAGAALDALKNNVAYDLSELQWILAVRKGDVATAKSKMPQRVTTRLLPVVLEMYELLVKLGDKDGLRDLNTAMKAGNLEECADAIENWHENRLQKIQYQFSSSTDPCVVTFALRVMKNNYTPERLRTLAKKIPARAYDLRTLVDRIHVTWKNDGYEPAIKQLDKLASERGNSGPLLVAIASQYMDMGAYGQARELLANSKYPEAIALYVQTLQALNKGRKAQIVLKKALENPESANHPALILLDILQKYEAGKINEVVEASDSAVENAGAWSSETASLKAMAMGAMGERGDADRYLNGFIKVAGRVGGLAESWDVQKSIIRINLRRGGNFMFKAVAYTVEMYKSKVDDAEVVFSYGVESQRQGNLKGAMRYFNDTIDIDPAYVPAYKELLHLGELTDEHRQKLRKFRPDVQL